MEACLAWINLNSTELAPRYYIIPRRGYTNKGWKKLDSSEEFILKTYDLTLQNAKNAWCFHTIAYPIQIIEQVHFNHTDGWLFTEAVLNCFDLRESQNAVYKNNIIKLSTAPTCLDVLYEGVRLFKHLKKKCICIFVYF